MDYFRDITEGVYMKEEKKETKQKIPKNKKEKKKTIISIVVVALAVIMILVATFVPFYHVDGDAMSTTIKENDLVCVMKSKTIQKGSIIAFYYNNKILVRRVIATGGEKVSIDQSGNVSVNGKRIKEDYTLDKGDLTNRDIIYPYTVPEGQYFVLGDHRSRSVDSRVSALGCVKKKDIIGKVVIAIWPITHFRIY